jgi:L,D-transpeptidase catalytic domain
MAIVAGCLTALGVGALGAFMLLGDDEEPAPIQPPTRAAATPPFVGDITLEVPSNRRIALRARPGGRIIARVGDRTEFGSPEILLPTGRRIGWWTAVRHTSLGNNAVAWVHRGPLVHRPRRVSLEVDLSRRELVVLREKRGELRRIPVAIGAPDTPTPPGEYYVTDKLRGADFGEFYGCCILALSGRQPNLPRGWSGGDRLAIHGSPTPTWGEAVSNGCFHASRTDLRYLMKAVPLGTPVSVRA